MTLWTLDDLVRALVENYEQVDIETKLLVPLKENVFACLSFDACFCIKQGVAVSTIRHLQGKKGRFRSEGRFNQNITNQFY